MAYYYGQPEEKHYQKLNKKEGQAARGVSACPVRKEGG